MPICFQSNIEESEDSNRPQNDRISATTDEKDEIETSLQPYIQSIIMMMEWFAVVALIIIGKVKNIFRVLF